MNTYMKRALTLARKGQGRVHPNPLVGAVIVRDDRVIGEGYHDYFGGPHAEVNAFNHATEDVQGATMYVTLEPCSHHGKTPPCADLIISKGIKEVFVASKDPNPLVAGKGLERLRQAGLHVHLTDDDHSQWEINKAFHTYITKQRPFVTLKTAMTADGKIAHASGESQWITNAKSRHSVHHLRASVRAIMVGKTTALRDDPTLTVRLKDYQGPQPTRLILDTHGTLPSSLTVFQTANEVPTWWVVSESVSEETLQAHQALGVNVIQVPLKDDQLDLNVLMQHCYLAGIDHVLVEAGSSLAWSLFKADLVDEYYLFIGPKILGGAAALTAVGGEGFPSLDEATHLTLKSIERLDQDVFIVYERAKE